MFLRSLRRQFLVVTLASLVLACGGSKPTIPQAPTAVVATAGDASATVSWTAPTDDGGSAILGYTVTSSPGGITATVSAPSSTATLSGLANGTSYTFTVVATNSVGDSAPSAVSSSVTPATFPNVPTGVVATASDTSATVSWTAPAGDGGSAILTYTVVSSPGGITATVSAPSTTATVTGLTRGTTYTFTVGATNSAGCSGPSSPSNPVTPAPIAPLPPMAVVATAGDASATVSWTAPTDDGGSALLSYTVTSVPGSFTATISAPTTTATVSGLTNGTSYTFTVVATSLVGSSAASSPSNSVTPAPPPDLVSIEVQPSDVLLATGFPRQMTALGHMSDDSTRDLTANVLWDSSAPTIVSITATGMASFQALGGATITATEPVTQIVGSLVIPARHVAFVTSVSGTGDLHSWPEAGAATGAAAGDAICQARAATAGLPGTFRAWLSDANDDAYCRIQGLSGKKAANCGQNTLPSAGGPWIRMDGHPFAPALGTLATGVLYTAAAFYENGNPAEQGAFYWAVTDTAGVLSWPYTACADWTAADPAQSTAGGSARGVDFTWTYIIAPQCSTTLHLLCLQAGGGPSLPAGLASSPGAKKAFITSVTGAGDLSAWPDAGGASGVAAGDAVCAARAAAAGLSGTFKAWLSDGVTGAIDRFSSNGPWVRVDGAAVAADKAGLASGTLLTNLVVTESGTYLVPLGSGQQQAWTGTLGNGTPPAPGVRGSPNDPVVASFDQSHDCFGWLTGLVIDTGLEGNTSNIGPGWTQNGDWTCDSVLHLYCFED